MQMNNENNVRESGKIFALTAVLMNILILTIVFGMFWLVQSFISQSNQLNALLQGFRT